MHSFVFARDKHTRTRSEYQGPRLAQRRPRRLCGSPGNRRSYDPPTSLRGPWLWGAPHVSLGTLTASSCETTRDDCGTLARSAGHCKLLGSLLRVTPCLGVIFRSVIVGTEVSLREKKAVYDASDPTRTHQVLLSAKTDPTWATHGRRVRSPKTSPQVRHLVVLGSPKELILVQA